MTTSEPQKNRQETEFMVDVLRQHAGHFVPRDWQWTRLHGIRHIRRPGDFSGHDHPLRRLARAARSFVRLDAIERDMFGHRFPMAWSHPIISIRADLRTPSHLPDGHLEGAGVIAYWEETGEYLQMVQPSVGLLLADLIEAHPELPEIQTLVNELSRIRHNYFARIQAAGGEPV